VEDNVVIEAGEKIFSAVLMYVLILGAPAILCRIGMAIWPMIENRSRFKQWFEGYRNCYCDGCKGEGWLSPTSLCPKCNGRKKVWEKPKRRFSY
jgi:hypothetical protein